MKHFLFIAAFILFLTCSLHAQWSWGFEVGGTGSMFQAEGDYKDLFDNKLRLGTTIGFLANFPLGDDERLRLQPGISFTQKGGKLVDEEGLAIYDGFGNLLVSYDDYILNERLNYLQVPLQLHYRLSKDDQGFVLMGGPYLGIGLNGKIDFETKPQDKSLKAIDVEFGDNELDTYTRADWGVLAGVGFFSRNTEKLRTWNLAFQVGLGLKSLRTTDQQNNSIFNGGLKNLNFQLTAAYTFDHDPH